MKIHKVSVSIDVYFVGDEPDNLAIAEAAKNEIQVKATLRDRVLVKTL